MVLLNEIFLNFANELYIKTTLLLWILLGNQHWKWFGLLGGETTIRVKQQEIWGNMMSNKLMFILSKTFPKFPMDFTLLEC